MRGLRVPLISTSLLGAVSGPAVAQLPAIWPVEVVRTGSFQDTAIRESSGVARSRTVPGLFYTINDSDNPPVVFAFDSSGRSRGRWLMPVARNRDWEALATGPCPWTSCLYIGDIGDNREREPTVTVLRVHEPLAQSPPKEATDGGRLEMDSLVFRYPDGPHDAEAMWVDDSGGVFIVTKGRTGGTKLFRAPPDGFRLRQPIVATLVQELPIPDTPHWGRGVTDAALAPDRTLVAIRTYTEVYLFPVLPSGRLGQPLGRCSLAGLEPQGEGVAWLDDGRLILTSESGLGGRTPGPIHLVRCGR
jgi:hypothetical protein